MVHDGVVAERDERRLVQARPRRRGEACLDRLPGDLVAEGESTGVGVRHQQAGADALVDGRDVPPGHLLDEGERGTGAEHRGRPEDVTRLVGDPGGSRQHGVTDRVRRLGGPRGQHLGDEEGVAARPVVQRRGVDLRPGGGDEGRDGLRRQRGKVHAQGAGHRGQVSEHGGEPVVRADLVVAEGRHREQGEPVEPSSEEAHQLQRRLVGPVQVLEHEQRGAGGQQRPDVVEQPGPGGRSRALDGMRELRHGVEHGAQRGGRGHVVAEATAHHEVVVVGAHPLQKSAHEGGLADAGLAAEEHPAAGPPRGRARHLVPQRRQLGVALHQHGPIQQPAGRRGQARCFNAP